MQNKDKGDGIEDSPLDMLLVILLKGASKEVVWLVTHSSQVQTSFGYTEYQPLQVSISISP